MLFQNSMIGLTFEGRGGAGRKQGTEQGLQGAPSLVPTYLSQRKYGKVSKANSSGNKLKMPVKMRKTHHQLE